MDPLQIGAALMVADLPHYRDWLIDGQRDLEIQDFFATELLLGDWQSRVDQAKSLLDGFEGRLGIHGPFIGVPIDNDDPEIAPLITKRFLTGLEICAALGATQMVVHSPYTTWDYNNFNNNPRVGNSPSARERKIAQVHAVMRPVVDRAAAQGVTLVIENIEDIAPGDRLELAQSFGSDVVKLSIDTGHAHYAHGSTGAPPVDYFVSQAGAMLDHVHLQDADGYADRHWAPGQGTINWHQVFRALAALPVKPHLVLELRQVTDIPAAMAYLEGEGLAC
ncbi:TIM barrel protein [Roseobacter sp. HKCCD9010]|uniref:sugar phosphate isomerase/epimerase family protein n=1 Tax=unclassified Roseobacter TaxID=196798 RepID=UPI001491AD2B|nr:MULTISPECIES: sugar phosphate isomerase/epimerase family protein [unclassified Roseobacter]MBF9051508.1 TIM barrel protein [Rhodobacterales bacterium HKCCD4356]NNV13032.1 TIM barrel protein [Roseobacter sp. HKCCD7357]NNV17283.1 TIM barrel protein [Roseobacter sp. HKCCD8768]NNV26889.1 TIM barrel protein [Roseobacter sp. HKCCD8192]NNV31009.1 TIM barrel protein [Roseobacter sp. HKCCD9061]